MKDFLKRLLSNSSFGEILTSLTYLVGLEKISSRLSRYSKYMPDIVSLSYGGYSFRMSSERGADYIVSHVWKYGMETYESPIPKIFTSLVKNSKVLFNIGANTGLYSILAAKVSPGLKVYAFEPYKPVYRLLERNIQINNLKSNIEIEQIALGDHNGEIELFIPGHNDSNVVETSASLNPKFRDRHAEVLKVPMVTLDSYCFQKKILDIDLILVDVESAEHLILSGAERILKNIRPIILLEVLEQADLTALQRLANEYSYSSFYFEEDVIKYQRKIIYRSENSNQILCPIEKTDNLKNVGVKFIGLTN